MKLKFTIRQMMIAMIAFGLLACCVAGANRGSIIGYGIIWGVLMMVIPVFVLNAVYLFAKAIHLISSSLGSSGTSAKTAISTPTGAFAQDAVLENSKNRGPESSSPTTESDSTVDGSKEVPE